MHKSPGSTGRLGNLVHFFSKAWGLHRKILLGMVSLLLLLGLTTALITRAMLLKRLKAEFLQKGLSSARSLAASGVVDILSENTARLNRLVRNEQSLDEDIAYVFIIDSSGRILAHTFDKGFPADLVKANNLGINQAANIQPLDTQRGLIYDIAAPILLEKNALLGQIRLGVYRKNIQRTIMEIDLIILAVTSLVILMGMLLAYRISSLITQPVSRLVEATQSIQKGDFSSKIDVTSNDEIGILAGAFNKMTAHLNRLVDEVGRLTKYKERERIAFDLHDNCAQDLANLIKRLELCEKLFKIEPVKALEELNALKENIRGHLGKARQIIHGLKSEEEDFALLEKIKEYIKDYQEYNGIKIKLDISESVNNNIPPDKSRQIFYIITEALTNIRKHAQAENVELSLGYNKLNELLINVRDDGKGFDMKEVGLSGSSFGGWGLMSMRQRAIALGGALSINSMPNRGTEVSARVPLSPIEYTI